MSTSLSFSSMTLLIAGCAIGAGMLALPVVSAPAGFLPSLLMMLIAAGYMLGTAYLLLEVISLKGSKEKTHLLSLTEATLGKWGKFTTLFLFLSLFYCIFVAYISGIGEITLSFFHYLDWNFIPPFFSLFLGTFLIFLAVAKGSKMIDLFNRYLLIGLFISYLCLLCLSAPLIEPSHLLLFNFANSWKALPIMVVSFGIHNLIPSLFNRKKGSKNTLRLALFCGMSIAFLFYTFWNGAILGILPHSLLAEKLSSHEVDMALDLLKNGNSPKALFLVTQCFSFFAIATSFITIALSFADFIEDGLPLKKLPYRHFFVLSLIFLPPFLINLMNPHLFLEALGIAGGFIAVILFGVLPCLMYLSIEKKKPFSLKKGGAVFLLGLSFIFIFLETQRIFNGI